MHYFRLETLGDTNNDKFCFIGSSPEEMGLEDYYPAKGKKLGSKYPPVASIYLQDKYPGFRLSSLIGTIKSYLIVHRDMKDVIEAHCPGVEIEYLPFTLYNHKKRVHSQDYFIVNPIGGLDVLDLKASVIKYLDAPGDPYHGAVVDVKKFVLDGEKVQHAPALFRVKEYPSEYFINETLANAFKERQFTNVVLEEIEVTRR